MTTEKFSLKWNDYQSNWSQSLSGLRNDTEMSDVTLITEDKVKILAHKIILSSCSNVFNFILKESKQSNPLLYLGGISSVNLGFILDYIYHGEVNIYQEQLDGFLESAQKLEVAGLLGDNKNNQGTQESEFEAKRDVVDIDYYKEEDHKQIREHQLVTNSDKAPRPRTQFVKPVSINANGPKFNVTGMTTEEIGDKIKSMYQKVDGVWTCLQCGRTSNNKSTDMRLHVETHLDGLCYTCDQCSQELRSKQSLKDHKRRNCTLNNEFLGLKVNIFEI